ncbi:MAG: AAA family ATPase [Bacilli bacterium]|nr:AAA family ATPase [Bacilli bacterium]
MLNNNSSAGLERLLKRAEKERIKLKHPYVGSEHLFLAILNNDGEFTKFLKEYNLCYSSFKKELVSVVGICKKNNDVNLYTPLLRKIIKRCENKTDNINELNLDEEVFLSLLDEGEGIAVRIMLKMNVDLDDIYFTLKERKKVRIMEVSNQVGVFLNNSVDLSEKVVGREEEISKIILSLTRKKKCNPILIGPAGVGKTAIVEELTRRIVKNEVPDNLKNYKVYMIEMGSLISGTKYRGEFEERLNKILKEIVNDKKTIIFIDEIHTMIGAGGAEGAINAADILKPYLARGAVKCIGATTTKEYNDSFLKDKALTRRFDVINVKEPDENLMYDLLKNVKNEYENFHHIKVSDKLLKKIINLSDYYLKNISNPDKSIDLLDSACAYAKINRSNSLTENDILKTVFYKTNNCLIDNKLFINSLKNNLKNILNVKEINKLCQSFSFNGSKPISILLNNVRVEEIIKDNLKDINIVNIDLNSYYYQSNNSLCENKNISETIFNTVLDKPFSLILFHNVNQANKYVLDEISKINKDGYIIFKNNEKLFFNNAIILASISGDLNCQTGFINNKVSVALPKEFINSFQCDLRNIHTKEIYTA